MRKSNYLSNLSAYCSKANLRVTPKRGSAIMWYNHVTNKTSGWISSLDLRSYHGGCDVIRGHKWIVNNWINIIGGNWDDLRTWNDKNSRTKWGKKEFARYRALPKKGRIVEIRLEVDFHFFACNCDGALITVTNQIAGKWKTTTTTFSQTSLVLDQ